MNPLQSRKQLLILESELNRVQLVQEWEKLSDGVHAVSDRAKSFSAVASTVAAVVAALAAWRRAKPARADGKRSWLQTILQSASLISTLWLAFRSPRPSRD